MARESALALALALCLVARAGAPSSVLSLGGSTKGAGGSPWTLRNSNGSLSIPATVPGVVHLDLLRAKKIAEPYYRYGELELAWVYREEWTYSRTIAAGALGAAPGRVLLRSEGLDTVATLTLNGVTIGNTSNMFHRPVWDVTSAFKPGSANALEIRFASPALASLANSENYPYPVSGSYITPLQYPSCGCPEPAACFSEAKGCDCLVQCQQSGHYKTTRNFLRKSQAHWGWDWGAGFLTSGIFRELSLVSVQHTSVIRDVVVQIFPTAPPAPLDPSENPTSAVRPPPSSFRVELNVFLISDGTQTTTISVTIPSLKATKTEQVRVGMGEQKVQLSLDLDDVQRSALWFPNGYGAAVLHDLTVTTSAAADADAEIGKASRWSKRIGLKRIELVQAPLPHGLPCGRADCGGSPGCSDVPTGGGYTCAFQKANGKCDQTLKPWHVPLGQCCATCFNCSAACLAAAGEPAQPEPSGLSMVFRVNGMPVFIKGANWVSLILPPAPPCPRSEFAPRQVGLCHRLGRVSAIVSLTREASLVQIATDQFEPRIPQRPSAPKGGEYESAGAGFEALLGSAKEAHYNMLRVWCACIPTEITWTPLGSCVQGFSSEAESPTFAQSSLARSSLSRSVLP